MSTAGPEVVVSRRALWLGLFGGAAAWTVHLMFAYAIAEFGCLTRLGDYGLMGISAVAWLEIALTAATALAAAGATAVAYGCHRRLNARQGDADAGLAAHRYTAWAGLLTSGMFTLVILFESIPILFYLHDC